MKVALSMTLDVYRETFRGMSGNVLGWFERRGSALSCWLSNSQHPLASIAPFLWSLLSAWPKHAWFGESTVLSMFRA